MDLFGYDPTHNVLPRDGIVNYFGPILASRDTGMYLELLLARIPWEHDAVVVRGERRTTARKVAWFGDANYAYTYSGATRHALAWTRDLQALRELVQTRCGIPFNACLANLYHDGSEGMAWHSDDETALERNGAIASLSLGAERRFCFRHKQSGQTINVMLEDGSLLVMKGETQRHWLHSLPKAAGVRAPRVNLTFRNIVDEPRAGCNGAS